MLLYQSLKSDSIPGIEKTLIAHTRPVAVGVPGYILPTNLDAHLFLNYREPVQAITVEPGAAFGIAKAVNARSKPATLMRE